jgi:hypothetical protein
VAFLSMAIVLEDYATAAARVLAEFVGGVAQETKGFSLETSAADLAERE